MAKRKGPNKSQAIREALEQNPKASAKDVVDALAAKGIKVAVGLVYMDGEEELERHYLR